MKQTLCALLLALALAALSACGTASQTLPPAENTAETTPETAPAEQEPDETPVTPPAAETPAPDDAEAAPEAAGDAEVPEAAESPEDSDTAPETAALPVLMRTGSFTGLTPLAADNDFHGGYLYADQTEDGLTVIYNSCLRQVPAADETPEDYLGSVVETVTGASPEKLTATEDSGHSDRLGWPVQLLTWQTEEGGKTWEGFYLMTDQATYLYAFCSTPDNAAAMAETWHWVFDELYLFDPTAQ